MRFNVNGISTNEYDTLFPDRFLLRTGNQPRLNPQKERIVGPDIVNRVLMLKVYAEYLEFLVMAEHGMQMNEVLRSKITLSPPNFDDQLRKLANESPSRGGETFIISDAHTRDEEYLQLKISEMGSDDMLIFTNIDMKLDILPAMYIYGESPDEMMSPFWVMTRALAFLRGERKGNWYLSIYEWNEIITKYGLHLVGLHRFNDTERHFALVFLKSLDHVRGVRPSLRKVYAPIDSRTILINVRNSLLESAHLAYESDERIFNSLKEYVKEGRYRRGYPSEIDTAIIEDWALINPCLSRGARKIIYLGKIKRYYNFKIENYDTYTIIHSDVSASGMIVDYDPCKLKLTYPWINVFDPFSKRYTLRYSTFTSLVSIDMVKELEKGKVTFTTDNVDAFMKTLTLMKVRREKKGEKVDGKYKDIISKFKKGSNLVKNQLYDFFVEAIEIIDMSEKELVREEISISDKFKDAYVGDNYEKDIIDLWTRYRPLKHPSPFSDEFSKGLFKADEKFGITLYGPGDKVSEDGLIPEAGYTVISDIYLPGYKTRQGNVYTFD